MISPQVYDYCKGDISKIENYEEAKNSKKTYACHHRLEIMPWSGKQVSQKYLKEQNMFYNREPEEFIFLTLSDHMKIHENGKKTRFKKGQTSFNKGKIFDNTYRKHISEGTLKAAKEKGIDYSHTKCRNEYRTNNPEHLDWNTFQKKFYKKEI